MTAAEQGPVPDETDAPAPASPWADDDPAPGSLCAASGCAVADADERIATAYHEAAHAVVRAKFGFRFDHVTIVPEDDSVGHLTLWGYHHEPDAPQDRALPDILIHGTAWFSGMAAESRYLASIGGPGAEECARCLWTRNGGSDVGRAATIQADPDFYKAAWQAAVAMVEENAEGIAAVASALLDRGTLQEAEVFELCPRRT